MPTNYHNKRFRAISNSSNGQVSEATLFHYRQEEDLLWGTYKGGGIRLGTITGLVLPDGSLDFHYQHVDQDNQIRLGRCHSTPKLNAEGHFVLHESWKWLNGDQSEGSSVIEEIKD